MKIGTTPKPGGSGSIQHPARGRLRCRRPDCHPNPFPRVLPLIYKLLPLSIAILTLGAGNLFTPAYAATFASNSHVLTNPYIPWSVGVRLDYAGYGDATGISLSFEVLAQEQVNGINSLKVITRKSIDADQFTWLAQDTDGIVWQVRSLDTLTGEFCEERVFYMPAAPALDQTYPLWDCYFDSIYTVTNLNATVSTPLQTFAQCLVLRLEEFGYIEELSFAPGVGLVKLHFDGFESGGWHLSNASGITLPEPPAIVITAHPADVTVSPGTSVTFSVTATGPAPLSYQWQRRAAGSETWDSLSADAYHSGTTTPSLTVSAALIPMDGDHFRCVVTSNGDSVTSQPAVLIVFLTVPTILSQPLDQAIDQGERAQFTVTAAGFSPLVYQWRKDGLDLFDDGRITGSTTETLIINDAHTGDTGAYSVEVSNSFGTEESQQVQLVVQRLTLADTVDASYLEWTTGGDVPWVPQRTNTFDGVDAARSGLILPFRSSSQTSWIETKVMGPGLMSFRWSVAAEQGKAWLSLLVNGVSQKSITEVISWQEVSFAVGPGEQRVRWFFDAEPFVSGTGNRGVLDQVRFIPVPTGHPFENRSAIQIPYGAFGANGSPYPSIITVSGMTGAITEVVVNFHELSMTTDAGGIDALLVAPSGQKAMLMSDTAVAFGLDRVTLRFDDLALASLNRYGSYRSGTYLPTDYVSGSGFPPDRFPAPAPSGPYPPRLGAFHGADPNGQWRLFIRNDSVFGGSGEMAGGWSLELRTVEEVMSLRTVRAAGDDIQFLVTGPPQAHFAMQSSADLLAWISVSTNAIPLNGWLPLSHPITEPHRFFRLVDAEPASDPPRPSGLARIPAGWFRMGGSGAESLSSELPSHEAFVSEFWMDCTEVTKESWDEVRSWGLANGYSFDTVGTAKGPGHPVIRVSWYDVVKWCNARSEKEGRVPAYYTDANHTTVHRSGRVSLQNDWVKWDAGYRLPTEAEWERAARGGLEGKRFSWGDTITHSLANYYSFPRHYDVSPTRGHHPEYATGFVPYTSPVGSFAANDYGLFDMTGNLWEMCWDRGWRAYSSDPVIDPRGPDVGQNARIIRGGGWQEEATSVSYRSRAISPSETSFQYVGFRCVIPVFEP